MFLKDFFNKLKGISIDDDFYDELEETLIISDIGVRTADELIEELRNNVKSGIIKNPDDARKLLSDRIIEIMSSSDNRFGFEENNSVILLIGVNGVGKTTTAGKLALKYKAAGRKVLLAAADTFRAAATEQLQIWSERTGTEIISGKEGTDPGSVVFDACHAAKARKSNVLICDTAGRLNNKKNLMAELKKISDIIKREYPEAIIETLIVIDATTGQNALEQVRQFKEIADISGLVITKMDGTAKGGIAVNIKKELGLLPLFIGYGERPEELKRFDPKEYAEALLVK